MIKVVDIGDNFIFNEKEYHSNLNRTEYFEFDFRVKNISKENAELHFNFSARGKFIYQEKMFFNIVLNDYELSQNYPNPFNPATLIKYAIPQDGMVTLSIFNLLGEKMGTLVNQVQKAGRYEVTFDARSYSSGIYFYKIESGTFSSVKKMMLMK